MLVKFAAVFNIQNPVSDLFTDHVYLECMKTHYYLLSTSTYTCNP